MNSKISNIITKKNTSLNVLMEENSTVEAKYVETLNNYQEKNLEIMFKQNRHTNHILEIVHLINTADDLQETIALQNENQCLEDITNYYATAAKLNVNFTEDTKAMSQKFENLASKFDENYLNEMIFCQQLEKSKLEKEVEELDKEYQEFIEQKSITVPEDSKDFVKNLKQTLATYVFVEVTEDQISLPEKNIEFLLKQNEKLKKPLLYLN